MNWRRIKTRIESRQSELVESTGLQSIRPQSTLVGTQLVKRATKIDEKVDG